MHICRSLIEIHQSIKQSPKQRKGKRTLLEIGSRISKEGLSCVGVQAHVHLKGPNRCQYKEV